jgi:hypothetical protein
MLTKFDLRFRMPKKCRKSKGQKWLKRLENKRNNENEWNIHRKWRLKRILKHSSSRKVTKRDGNLMCYNAFKHQGSEKS